MHPRPGQKAQQRGQDPGGLPLFGGGVGDGDFHVLPSDPLQNMPGQIGGPGGYIPDGVRYMDSEQDPSFRQLNLRTKCHENVPNLDTGNR